MARCEVCGVEQFPANTVVRLDSDYNRHFFCSQQHAKAWEVEKEHVAKVEEVPRPKMGADVVEIIVDEAPPLPKKRMGRPPKSKTE